MKCRFSQGQGENRGSGFGCRRFECGKLDRGGGQDQVVKLGQRQEQELDQAGDGDGNLGGIGNHGQRWVQIRGLGLW